MVTVADKPFRLTPFPVMQTDFSDILPALSRSWLFPVPGSPIIKT
jgi:hypothetical protein